MASPALDTKTPFWLYAFSLFLAGATILLILAGGLVTSHEAGLAVPDWPLSYGKFFPPMVGNIFWEHGHRMIAGTVAMLTLVLAIGIQISLRATGRSPLPGRLAWTAFGTVILQALLGGLTVLYMLPPAVSIFHACLAQTFFCLTVALAHFLDPNTLPSREVEVKGERESPKRLAIMTAAFIYLQLILGATIRHTAFTVVPHVIFAFLVFLHVMLLGVRILRFHGENKALAKLGLGLVFSTITQIFLGMGAFIFTRMLERGYRPLPSEIFFTASHQTLGAVILALSVWICLKVWR